MTINLNDSGRTIYALSDVQIEANNGHNVARKKPYKYLLQVKITDDKTERAKQLGHYRVLPESTRKQVLERDNHTCQLCGQYGNVADHIIPWRISQDNSKENLRCLCSKCNTITRLLRRDARPSYEELIAQIKEELGELVTSGFH